MIDDLEQKEDEIKKEKKKHAENEKIMEQLKNNCESVQEEVKTLRAQWEVKEKDLAKQLSKAQKELREEQMQSKDNK